MAEAPKDFRHIVRVSNTDLEGSKHLVVAMRKIKGVSFMFANAVCSIAGVEKNKIAGKLNQDEVARLEAVLSDPLSKGIPEWMANRRKDMETGSDTHIIGADLRFTKENDIKTMRKIKSFRGTRHSAGLPLRGQRTKSNFRRKKSKGSLGVQRRKGAKSGK